MKPFISSEKIEKRVSELAKKITYDYRNKVPIFIGILNGSFIFMSDLLRKVKLDAEIDFLQLSSYGYKKSPGKICMLKSLDRTIKGRHTIVVEDIIDSGLSAQYIYNFLSRQNPKSLEFVCLLYKRNVDKLKFKVKYLGFKIPDKFFVGYGLDYAQKYRNLKSIYIL